MTTHSFTGTYRHTTSGEDFTYTATYSVARPTQTWQVTWDATALGTSGKGIDLTGGEMEILVGSDISARLLVEKEIRRQIDLP